MIELYLPFPEWDGSQWTPWWDKSHNIKYGFPHWVDGFDPSCLDHPRFMLGEVIAFGEPGRSWWDPTTPCRIQVQRIRYTGAGYLQLSRDDMRDLPKIALARYRQRGIEYEGPLQYGRGPRGHWWYVDDKKIDAIGKMP